MAIVNCGERDRREGERKEVRRRQREEKKIECLCDCLSHDTCNVVCLFKCKVYDVRYIKFRSMLCVF